MDMKVFKYTFTYCVFVTGMKLLKVESCFWLLTCDSSFGVEELEDLLWEDAMTDFASLLWQRGHWGQTLGRCVQGAGCLDQTEVHNIIIKSLCYGYMIYICCC